MKLNTEEPFLLSALMPLPLNCNLAYAISKVQVNQQELKLKVLKQLLVYAENISLTQKNINTSTEVALKAML